VEKRFILFIALSVGIMMAFMAVDLLIKQWRGPAADPNVAQNDGGDADGGDAADADAANDAKADAGQADAGQADAGQAAAEAADAAPDGSAAATDGETQAADGVAAPKPEQPDEVKPAEAEQAARKRLGLDSPEWIAVGSLDPKSEYPALYMFSTLGAALVRVELNDPKYKDLQDESGYFGHLALTDVDDEGGCLVNVVGRGTPADLAKIRKGDTIVGFNGKRVASVAALNRALRETHPGQTAKLTIVRAGAATGGAEKREQVDVKLIRRPLEVIRPEPLDVDHLQPLDVDTSDDPLSLLLTLGGNVKTKTAQGREKGEFKVLERLRYANWKVELLGDPERPSGVQFSLGAEEGLDERVLAEIGLSGKLRILKRYRLVPTADDEQAKAKYGGHKAHHAVVEIELVNDGDTPINNVQYVFDGPNGLPAEGWWYSYKVGPAMFAAAGARDVIYKTEAMQFYEFVTCYTIWDKAENSQSADVKFVPADPEDARTLKYAGVDSQYFSAVLIPGTLENRGAAFNRLELAPVDMSNRPEKAYAKLTNVSFALTSRPIDIAPGKSHVEKFVFFAGPKQSELIKAYGLGDYIYYGWFGYVSEPLIWVLHFFHWFIPNYGLAIILLTVLVRGCMFPISRKAVRNAQMMSALAPEMKGIAEKYKDDMEKRGKAQRELFAKYNYNPFGGCLLMFLQLPIFLGLYRALCVDLELRGAPLIPGISWCSNLAAPDMLFRWEGWWDWLTAPVGYLGPYFNLLPLFTVALFTVQQKMFTPPPTDETQKLQQNMMMFMTLFIGVMFFKVPAGLCVYFIASSLWGVAERKVFPKPKLPAELEKKLAEAKNKPQGEVAVAKPGGNGAAERAWRKKEKGRK
jgi:YidC/Oxa1 family membrane protein insertase